MKSDHGVIIVDCFIDNESIWGLLPLQNGGAEVPLRTLAGESQKETKKIKKIRDKQEGKRIKSMRTQILEENADLEMERNGLTSLTIQLDWP